MKAAFRRGEFSRQPAGVNPVAGCWPRQVDDAIDRCRPLRVPEFAINSSQ